ncbi:MAG: T9SS type A sorting domain-containing protein [Bacteroidota bacterium]
MKSILRLSKKCLLMAAGMLLAGNIALAQDITVDPGLNSLVDAVDNNPGATLILQKGATYVVNKPVTITQPTIIRGEEYSLEDTDPPALVQMYSDPGEAMWKDLFIVAADLTLENLGLIGYTTENEQFWALTTIDKDGVALTLDGCVIQGAANVTDTWEHNRGVYKFVNNIHFNISYEGWDNWGGHGGVQYKGDSCTLESHNNTYFVGGRCFGLTAKGITQTQTVTHNTYVNTWGETIYKPYDKEFTLTNNIFYNTNLRGYVGERSRADTVFYAGDDISNDDYTDTLNGDFPIKETDLDGATRTVEVTNNLKFYEQRVLAWHAANNVTTQPFSSEINDSLALLYGWNIANNFTPKDNNTFDPVFAMGEIPEASFELSMIVRMERTLPPEERSAGFPYAIAWWVDDAPKGEFTWPLPFDFTPTNEAVLDAGDDDYPLGDLNWFGPEVVAAWEAGESNPLGIKEMEALNMSLQNYPNPFGSITTIRYELPVSSHVTMRIYNISGAEVATLVNENQIAGQHELTFDGANLSGGVYFCEIKAANASQVHKMSLIK